MDLSANRSDIDPRNANAAALFTAGRIREASLSWHGVIQRVLPLASSTLTSLGDANAAAGAMPLEVRRLGSFAVLPIAPCDDPSLLSRITSEDRTFSLYASAIQYVPRRPEWGGGSFDDDMAMAASAMYNLGLCLHLQAILDETRAPGLFEKALRAYAASQRILEASELYYVAPTIAFAAVNVADDAAAAGHHMRGLRLLQLALTNNVGHIFEQLHRREAAEQCLLDLHYQLATLDDGRPWTAPHDAAPPPERLLAYGAEPFVPFFMTAAVYPADHKIGLPAASA